MNNDQRSTRNAGILPAMGRGGTPALPANPLFVARYSLPVERRQRRTSVASVISVASGNNQRPMTTDHGSRINNNEVPNKLFVARCSLPIERRQRRLAAFTLIEMLVVLAIIILLIGILIPAAIMAQRYAYSSTTQSDLASIGQALSAYHADFNMYPNSSWNQGAIGTGEGYDYLAYALLGYTPGGSGPVGIGFKMKPYNKVYGPYMSPSAQNITPDGASGNFYFSGDFPPTAGAPLPILYFSATPNGGASVFGAAGSAIFTMADDSNAPNMPSSLTPSSTPDTTDSNGGPSYQQYLFLQLVGDKTGTNSSTGETIIGSNSYLLVAPGPSQVYFAGDNLVYGQ